MRSELDANLKEAIKSQEKQRVATLRLINAAIKDRDIAVRSEENTEGVSDAEIILILSNMVKQRKQSIIQYEEGGRIELAEREREEIKIIQEFLPNQLTDEEIHIEISKLIDAQEQLTIKDIQKANILRQRILQKKNELEFGAVNLRDLKIGEENTNDL